MKSGGLQLLRQKLKGHCVCERNVKTRKLFDCAKK
jgi:hypothetical protein